MRFHFLVAALLVSNLHADLVITEVMAQSVNLKGGPVDGDWWELTNTGDTAVDLSGYQWDDIPTPLIPTISNFPGMTIQAGESIIILEEPAINVSTWKAAWGLTTTRVVDRDQFTAMGGEGFSGLGVSGDEVNLYDPSGTLVAHAEFGPSITGNSQAFLRDGKPIHGLHSTAGKHGAFPSTLSPADLGSPGDPRIHFKSPPTIFAKSTYSYPILAVNPGGVAPTVSATSIPSFLTLSPGAAGSATLSNNRLLTLADAGNYLVQITATSGAASTIQEYMLTVLNPTPSVILNEYNAVSGTNFLNGGIVSADDDGGVLSSDSHFGRVAGNGGQWVEFVVVGSGGPGLMDMRGWKIEIGKNLGSGFAVQNSLVLSIHSNWQSVPVGTILTFTANNSSQGGLDSGFSLRNRRSSLGDSWTNIWMGDPAFLTYTSPAANGYSLGAGIVSGITIDNIGTQFRVRNASGQIVFGPVGEGVAPFSGTNSREVFELENHPTTLISPAIASSPGIQGYGDGAADSTFGYPNKWLDGTSTVAQSFVPYVADGFLLWTESRNLAAEAALKTADPDGDGRDNFHEYAFGGNPSVKDAPYATGAVIPGAVVAWSYVRRNNDAALTFSHQASENLAAWSTATALVSSTAPFPADPQFSWVNIQVNRPVPAPAKWFLRAKVE